MVGLLQGVAELAAGLMHVDLAALDNPGDQLAPLHMGVTQAGFALAAQKLGENFHAAVDVVANRTCRQRQQTAQLLRIGGELEGDCHPLLPGRALRRPRGIE